jgi:acyl carrier protein phosphodiesterase
VNFLGHLLLADQTTTSLAGAVLGDWQRGRIPDHYPAELRLGIALHRRIDVMTDAHPAIVATRRQFPAGQRRFAGIVLDIVTDHLLSRHWHDLTDEKLEDFVARSGHEVAAHARWFDEAGGYTPGAGEFERLLLSYRTADGVQRALRRTAERFERGAAGLVAAAESWSSYGEALEPRLTELLGDLGAAALAFVRDAQTGPAE